VTDAIAKVLVVDDHPIFRAGLVGILSAAGYEVLEATDGQHAVNVASSVRPRLVIMDVMMPGMSGIEATERIIAQDPTARVLMLSAADSPETVRAALRAGATSYITKTVASRDFLLDSLRRTSEGERVLAPGTLMDALLQDPALMPPSDFASLTLREREIVTLVAQGSSNGGIARALGLSPRTVENHIARIYEKLGIDVNTPTQNNRIRLALTALRQQMDRYPWNRQVCAVLCTDIAGFASAARSDHDRMALRSALYQVLEAAFAESGIPWSACLREDRGDGMLIIAPPGIPASTIIDPFLGSLSDQLRVHNDQAEEALTMQLRASLHVGPVVADDLGASGEAIVHAARLLDARSFKERLRAGGADLGVIISEFVYDTVIRNRHVHLNPPDLQQVDVSVKKARTTARMWFSGNERASSSRISAAMLRLLDDAERAALKTADQGSRAEALANVAEMVAASDPGRAARVFSDAEHAAQSVADRWQRERALRAIASALASVDPDRAERLAQSITDEGFKGRALSVLVESVAASDPDRAERIAQLITDKEWKVLALASAANVLTAADPDRAARLSAEAERVAHSITDEGRQAQELVRIARIGSKAT